MEKIFTPIEVWFGGYFELAIDLGRQIGNDAFNTVLTSIWSLPNLEGPYTDLQMEPLVQRKVTARVEQGEHLRGVLIVDGHQLACGTWWVSDDFQGLDIVAFYVPIGSIERVLGKAAMPTGPIGPELTSIVSLFHKVATMVWESYKFRIALVGHEVSADANADTITPEGLHFPIYEAILPVTHRLAGLIGGTSLGEDLICHAVHIDNG